MTAFRIFFLLIIFSPFAVSASYSSEQKIMKSMVDSSDIPVVPDWVLDDKNLTASISSPSQFDMQGMPLSQVISLYFKEVSKQPYVLCDAVLNDNRFVSIRADGRSLDAAIFRAVLDSNGYEVRNVSGVATVCLKPVKEVKDDNATKGTPFVYRPKYQDVAYLVDILSPLVDGHFANRRSTGGSMRVGGGGQGDSSVANQSAQGDEFIIFSGEQSSIDRLKVLLNSVDVPSSSVVVRAVLYEVSRSEIDASALKVMAELFSGKVGVSFGKDAFSNTLSINTSSFDFVASAISEDGRFKVVTSPFARVRNNQRVRLQVGADVPVAGEILINPNGQTTQSTEYRSSGVILDVSARVRGSSIDVDLIQTVSNFVQTKTGNSNPTLNKREIQTSLSLSDGELVVLGGVSDSKDEKTSSGLFGWNFSSSDSDTDSELVLLLQVKKV